MSLHICFFTSDKPREHLLADAVCRGAAVHGHTYERRPLGEDVSVEGFDVACFVGVKSRALLSRITRTGAAYIMFDKGYSRQKKASGSAGWEYWRVAVNSHHPTRSLIGQKSPFDRWDKLELSVMPWRATRQSGHVLFAGSSAKYHDFYGLKDPTTFAKGVVRDIRAVSEREIIYRPKPSWADAVPLLKTHYSRPPEGLNTVLKNCHVMVTHGSNAAWEAVLAGVPCIVIGDGVAKVISDTVITEQSIATPHLASRDERMQWFANLAWWQWTGSEFASGEAWDFIGKAIHGH